MHLRALNRKDLLLAMFLAMMTIVAGYCQIVVGVCGVCHDDGIYVSTGKALSQGYGYRLISLPGCPLQSKCPFIYPLLLGIIWKLWPSFPDNLVIMQFLNLCFGAATVGLSYIYLVRFNYFSRGIAFVAGLLCATSTQFLYFATIALSEMLFALFTILMMFALEQQLCVKSNNRLSQLLLGVILALPFLTRAIGFVFIPIALLGLYLSNRPIRWVALGVTLMALPWTLWMILVPKIGQSPAATSWYISYLSWWRHTFGFSFMGQIFLFNFLGIACGCVQIGMTFFRNVFQLSGWSIPIVALFWSTATLDAWRQIGRQRILSYLLFGYLTIVVLWPWSPFRYLIPIMPFLLAYLLGGIWKTVQKYSSSLGIRILAASALGMVTLANLGSVYKIAKLNERTSYPQLLGLIDNPVAWSSYQKLFRWIKTHTEPTDVVAYGLDPMIYLYTGRQAFRPFVMRPGEMFYGQKFPAIMLEEQISYLSVYRPKYLVQTPMPASSPQDEYFDEILRQIRQRYPNWLKTVYVGSDKRFIIFEIQHHLGPPSESGRSMP